MAADAQPGGNRSPASLIDKLHSDDPTTARQARAELVALGPAALPYLMALLSDSHRTARWEAAKALGELDIPEAAPALVQALQDEDGGVRWLAADALARCDLVGLNALLHELLHHSDSPWLREGAHHVLSSLAEVGVLPAPVRPVLRALEEVAPEVGVLNASARALEELNLHRYVSWQAP